MTIPITRARCDLRDTTAGIAATKLLTSSASGSAQAPRMNFCRPRAATVSGRHSGRAARDGLGRALLDQPVDAEPRHPRFKVPNRRPRRSS
jgi:hypothetical protein